MNTIAESFAQDTTIPLALYFPNRRMSVMSVCGEENAKRIEPTTFSCPRCAEEKRKNQPPLPTYEEMQAARMARKARKNAFWDFVGAIGIIGELGELNEKPPIRKQSILNSTCYDGEHLHTEEGHDTEDGYCMECDMAVEDIQE